MRVKRKLTTRFAPAPTGYLHLGHILSAAFVWGIGRRLGAEVLLRIEDHDRQRSRKAYETAILEDLDWLGFVSDNRESFSGDTPSLFRQSDRLTRYQEVEELLPTYRCHCSRKQIAESQPKCEGELCYPGTCRDIQLPATTDHGIRVRLPDQTYPFHDEIHGSQSQTPSAQCGDLLIRDRNGNYTYNYAVVVDDLDQGVNLIIRGDDIFHCTGRQLALHTLLHNRNQLTWIHHPLLTDSSGRKLGKSHQSTAIRELKAQGRTPQEIIGMALHAAGLLPTEQRVEVDEISSYLPSN